MTDPNKKLGFGFTPIKKIAIVRETQELLQKVMFFVAVVFVVNQLRLQ